MQRYCTTFSQKLSDTQAQTIQRIQQAIGDDSMEKTQIKEWYNCCKRGFNWVENEVRLGRPYTGGNEEVIWRIVTEGQHVTIQKITYGLSYP